MDKEIAAILNKEGFCGRSWLQIQRRERLVAAKTLGYPYGQNQRCQYEPDALARWQFLDPRSRRQHSVFTTQTVFDYLARGLLAGHQLTKGQPWQIELTDKQIIRLRARVRNTKHSKKEAP
jgi:hypothetical protein